MSIFQQASRAKLRFATQLGQLSTEDLWELPLTSAKGVSLKSIATDLQTQVSAQPMKELDFFELPEATDSTLQLRFDIVKHIVTTRVAESRDKSAEAAKETKRAQLQALINDKLQDELKNKSVEELQAELASL